MLIVFFLDRVYINAGVHTLIVPDSKLYTPPHHSMDYLKRSGNKICLYVTIGDRCVIGAGSVVTKDIEADSVAVGNPAKVIRQNR